MSNNEIIKILKKPQTVKVKNIKSTDFDNICEVLK